METTSQNRRYIFLFLDFITNFINIIIILYNVWNNVWMFLKNVKYKSLYIRIMIQLQLIIIVDLKTKISRDF